MEPSTTQTQAAQAEPDTAWEEVLPQLDDQDFVVIKVLEDHGPRDAVQVAGTARLRPGGVLQALQKLQGLGVVRIQEPSTSKLQEQFALTGENLVPFHSSISSE
jgi:DNA-binding Lrp family transcriptional regulator